LVHLHRNEYRLAENGPASFLCKPESKGLVAVGNAVHNATDHTLTFRTTSGSINQQNIDVGQVLTPDLIARYHKPAGLRP